MPGETSQANRGDSLIIGSRRFGSPLTRDNPEVGIVTERVPPDLPDAGTNGCRLQLSLEDGLLPARKAFVISENPVPGRTPGTVLSKFLQVHRENRIEWQGPGRAFRLCLAHTSLHNSPLDEDIPVLPVEVTPLQADDFAHAQTQRDSYQNHGSIWFGQLRQERSDLVGRQNARNVEAPAALAHQLDGISVDQFPPPRVLIEKVHETSNVSLALGCELKLSEPLLDCHGLDFIERVAAPSGPYPAVENRQVRPRCGVAFGQFVPDVPLHKSIDGNRPTQSTLHVKPEPQRLDLTHSVCPGGVTGHGSNGD